MGRFARKIRKEKEKKGYIYDNAPAAEQTVETPAEEATPVTENDGKESTANG